VNRINRLKKLLDAIEASADPDELTQAAILLESLRDKISVRSMPLPLQRNAVLVATNSGDKTTLRRFENSQHAEIREWARQAQLPRGITLRM
jgi:hypothetical protein